MARFLPPETWLKIKPVKNPGYLDIGCGYDCFNMIDYGDKFLVDGRDGIYQLIARSGEDGEYMGNVRLYLDGWLGVESLTDEMIVRVD